MPDNDIYNFLKQNNLTTKDEASFMQEYSDPQKAQQLFNFFKGNNLTTKDSATFYNTYFNPVSNGTLTKTGVVNGANGKATVGVKGMVTAGDRTGSGAIITQQPTDVATSDQGTGQVVATSDQTQPQPAAQVIQEPPNDIQNIRTLKTQIDAPIKQAAIVSAGSTTGATVTTEAGEQPDAKKARDKAIAYYDSAISEKAANMGVTDEDLKQAMQDFPDENDEANLKTWIDRKNNNEVKYNRTVPMHNVQVGIANKLGNHVANQFIDLNQDYQTLDQLEQAKQQQVAIINQAFSGNERQQKLSELEASESPLINIAKPDVINQYNASPLKDLLNPNQFAGLKTLQIFEPDKYDQYVNALNESRNVQMGSTDYAIGLERIKKELEDIGMNNLQTESQEKLTDLGNQAKQMQAEFNAIPKPDLTNKASVDAYNAKVNEYNSNYQKITNQYNAIQRTMDGVFPAHYPNLEAVEKDEQIKELLGYNPAFGQSGAGVLPYRLTKTAIGNTLDALENIATDMFGSNADKANLFIKRKGQADDYYEYEPEKFKSTGSKQIYSFPDDVVKKAQNIQNNNSLSDEQKYLQLSKLVDDNSDKINLTPNAKAGQPADFFSKATLYHNLATIGDIGGYAAQTYLMGGGGVVGDAAGVSKAQNMINAAVPMFLSSQNDFYKEAIEKGIKNPSAYAYVHATIMAAAGLINPDINIVKRTLGLNTVAGRTIAGIADDTWKKVLSDNPELLKKIVNSGKSVLGEAAKIGAVYGAGTSIASDVADKLLFNQPLSGRDILDHAYKSTKDLMQNSLILFGVGAIKNFRSVTPEEKQAIYHASDNPDLAIKDIQDNPKLSVAQKAQRIKVVGDLAVLKSQIPDNIASPRDRHNYLYNLYIKNKATDLAKTLPEKQKTEFEKIAVQADEANNLLIEQHSDDELKSRKTELEKSLAIKEGDGKLTDKERVQAEGELAAVNDEIDNRKRIKSSVTVTEPRKTGEETTEGGVTVIKPAPEGEPAITVTQPKPAGEETTEGGVTVIKPTPEKETGVTVIKPEEISKPKTIEIGGEQVTTPAEEKGKAETKVPIQEGVPVTEPAAQPTGEGAAKPEDAGTIAQALANHIRSYKIPKQKGVLKAQLIPDFGIPRAIANKAIDLMADHVERGTKLGQAIAKTIKWVDDQMGGKVWDKKGFGGYFAEAEARRQAQAAAKMPQVPEVTGAKQIKLPDGRQVTAVAAHPDVVNGFYSPLEKTLLDTKADNLTSKQWQDRFGKGEEAKWTGLNDFLNSKKPDEKISKKDIADYLKNNRVEIHEVVKGDKLKEYAAKRDEAEKKAEDLESQANRLEYIEAPKEKDQTKKEAIWKEAEDLRKQASQWRSEAERMEQNLGHGDTGVKYAQYQEAGDKSNYKEILVTLPSKKIAEYNEARNKYDAFMKELGWDTPTKEQREQHDILEARLKEAKKNLPENVTIGNRGIATGGEYKSSHWDEPNILVHVRMNTRTDANGKKVLFIEENQSDWGQEGRKQGFGKDEETIKSEKQLQVVEDEIKRQNDNLEKAAKRMKELGLPSGASSTELREFEMGRNAETRKLERLLDTVKNNRDWEAINKHIEELSTEMRNAAIARKNALDNIKQAEETRDRIKRQIEIHKQYSKTVPEAPFITETPSWTKLGLKIALKEAVKQGADKIAWTTGEQQNERYDLSKQVDYINANKIEYGKDAGKYMVNAYKNGADLLEQQGKNVMTAKEIEATLGKEIAEKIVKGVEEKPVIELRGDDLAVGGEGMKGFYGSPKEGKLGIMGNVAKSLFKQEPKITEIPSKTVYATSEITKSLDGDGKWEMTVYNPDGGYNTTKFDTKKDAEIFRESLQKNIPKSQQHSVDITPEMRAEVQKGLPLFQKVADALSGVRGKLKGSELKAIGKAFTDRFGIDHEVVSKAEAAKILNASTDKNEFFQILDDVDVFNSKNPNEAKAFIDKVFATVSDADEAKRAYRKLAVKYHPDKAGSTEVMQYLNDAKGRYDKGQIPKSSAGYSASGFQDFARKTNADYAKEQAARDAKRAENEKKNEAIREKIKKVEATQLDATKKRTNDLNEATKTRTQRESDARARKEKNDKIARDKYDKEMADIRSGSDTWREKSAKSSAAFKEYSEAQSKNRQGFQNDMEAARNEFFQTSDKIKEEYRRVWDRGEDLKRKYRSDFSYQFDEHNVPAGFYDPTTKKAYFVKGVADETTPIHEAFSHPFIEAIAKDNPELHQKLLNEAKSDKQVTNYVDARYGEDARDAEYIARAIDLEARGQLKNKTLSQYISDFWNQAKQYFADMFGGKAADIKNIDGNTTIKDIVNFVLKSNEQLPLGKKEVSSQKIQFQHEGVQDKGDEESGKPVRPQEKIQADEGAFEVSPRNAAKREATKAALTKLRDEGLLVTADRSFLSKAKRALGGKGATHPMTDAEINAQMSLIDAMAHTWKRVTGKDNFYDTFISDVKKGNLQKLRDMGGVLHQDQGIQPYTPERARVSLALFDDKAFKQMEDKQVSVQQIRDLVKGRGKQIEKDLVNTVLDFDKYKDQKKIPFNEFRNDVEVQIMKLEPLRTNSYADYGVENLGDNVHYGDEKTIIYNAPINHGETGHFSGDFTSDKTTGRQWEARELGSTGQWAAVATDMPADTTEATLANYVGTAGNKYEVERWIRDRNKQGDINKGLFGHIRRWFNKNDGIFHIAELQSDYFQKNKASDLLAEKIPQDEVDAYMNEHVWLPHHQQFAKEVAKKTGITVKKNTEKNQYEAYDKDGNRLSSAIYNPDDENNKNTGSAFAKEQAVINGLEALTKTMWVDVGRDANDKEVWNVKNNARGIVKQFSDQKEAGDYAYEANKKADEYKTYYDEVRNRYWDERKALKSKEQEYINKRVQEEAAKGEKNLILKQFIASAKVHEARLLREAIKTASEEGAKTVRLPDPYTLAVIEGYVSKGEGDKPYDIVRARNESRLRQGDIIDYGGTEMMVVDSDSDTITVAPKDDVYVYDRWDLVNDRVDSDMSDLEYGIRRHFNGINNITREEVESFNDRRGEYGTEKAKELMEQYFEDNPDEETMSWSDIESDMQDYFRDNYDSYSASDLTGSYGAYEHGDAIYSVEGRHSVEEFNQPDGYESDSDHTNFEENLSDAQQTVVDKYKELNKLFKKMRPDTREVTDDNGMPWLESDVTDADRKNPIVAFQNEGAKVKGAVDFANEGKATVHLFDGADISTLAHEFTGHIGRRVLERMADHDPEFGKDYEKIKKWAGVKDNQWSTRAEEKFARGLEKYLREGKAPTKALESVFKAMKEWLTNIYKAIKGSKLNVNLTDDVRSVFDKLLGKEPEQKQSQLKTKERAVSIEKSAKTVLRPESKGTEQELGLRQVEQRNQPEKPTPTEKVETIHPEKEAIKPQGNFEQKARDFAKKLDEAKLPKWLGTDDPNIQRQGLSAGDMKRLLGRAIIAVGKLLDKGVEFSEAIKQATKDLVAAHGAGKEDEVIKNFTDYYKKNFPENVPKLRTSGIHHEALNKLAAELEKEAIERGNRMSAEESYNMGRERKDAGDDPEQLRENLKNPKWVPNATDIGLAKAHQVDLDEAAERALKKAKGDKTNQEYQDAVAAADDWARNVAKKLGTRTSEPFTALQGVVDMDNGNFISTVRNFTDATGKKPTAEQEQKIQDLTEENATLKKNQDKWDQELKEATDKAFERGVEEGKKKAGAAAKPRTLTERGKSFAEKIRKNKFHRPDSFSVATPASLVWDAAVETVAKSVEAGGRLGDAIQDGIRHIQGTAWYKSLTQDKKDQAEEDFNNWHLDQSGLADLQKQFENKKSKDLKFRFDEAKALWDYAKQTYDITNKNVDYLKTIKNVADDTGLTFEQVAAAFSSPKTKPITDEVWANRARLRNSNYKVKDYIEKQKQNPIIRGLKTLASVPRAVATALHGHIFAGTHYPMGFATPEDWGKYFRTIGRSYKYAYSKEAVAEKAKIALESRDTYLMAQRAGLQNDVNNFNIDDFEKAGKLFGWLGKTGQRGFLAMKELRQDMFDGYWNRLPTAEQTSEVAEQIAYLVNNATGASNIKIPSFIKEGLFSAGMESARWGKIFKNPAKAATYGSNILYNLIRGREIDPAQRVFAKMWARRVGQQMATMMGVLAANAYIQSKINPKNPVNLTDPTQKDWLKLKIGDQDVDLSGGVLGVTSLLTGLAGYAANEKEGGFQTVEQVGGKGFQYIRGKANPLYGIGADIAIGTDYMGNPLPFRNKKTTSTTHKLSWGEYLSQRSPIFISDIMENIYKGAEDNGMNKTKANKVINGILDFGVSFGTGVHSTPSRQETKKHVATFKTHF